MMERIWHNLEEKEVTSLSYQPFWLRSKLGVIMLYQRMDNLYMIGEKGNPLCISLLKQYGYTHWSYVNQELENKPTFENEK